MDPLKVGLVGLGRHGTRYANHLINDVFGLDLTGVIRDDISKGIPSELEGIELFKDMTDLMKGSDIIIIATPTDSHFNIASKALEMGKHVLLEKPMAGTVDECKKLVETEKITEGSLSIAQTLRYSPVLMKLKDELKSVGPVRWFEMVQSLEPPKTPWLLEDRAMGGCVLNTGVHVFDTVSHILGDINSVSCTLDRYHNPIWEDYAYGDLMIRSGVEGAFKISRNGNFRSCYLRVDLEEGFLWADPLTSTFYQMDDGIRKKEIVKGQTNTLIPLLEDLRDTAIGKIEPKISGLDGMKAVNVAISCYISGREKREVSCRMN